MANATMRSDELKRLARGRLGLIIGPDATTADPNFFFRLAKHLADAFGVAHQGTFHEVGERATQDGHPIEAIRQAIVSFASAQTASPILTQLAKVRWSAILSAAIDWQFESRVEQENMRRPLGRDVVVVTDPSHVPASSTLPIFKLLGSAQRADVVATTSDFLKRLPFLSDLTRQFVQDYVRASPVLCVGFAGAPWMLEPLLAHLFGQTRIKPGKMIFLSDDPVVQNSRLYDLIPPSSLVIAEGSVVDVARAVEPSVRNLQLELGATRAAEDGNKQFELDGDMFAAVWPGMSPGIPLEERERLLDYLFMPEVPNWDAFLHNLDFPRSVSSAIGDAVVDRIANVEGHVLTVVHGRAASGKTTVLKRLGLHLSSAGFTSIWTRDYWHGDALERLNETFRSWAAAKIDHPLILFVDDPNKVRELSVPAMLDAADRNSIRLVLVVGVRTSIFGLYARNTIAADRKSEYLTFEIPDELDSNEWEELPEYLVKLGVYPTIEAGKLATRSAQGQANTQDTLALLYWLLPKTRQQIEHSIQTEYVSLGDSRGLQSIVIGSIQHSSQKLQEAYAMVAVAARYGVALPIEILVGALGFGSYGEWLDAVDPSGPAWGLFYPHDDEDLEGTCYTPRNEVVTKTVLKIVNGGTLTHEGEVRCLRRLLAACTSSNYVYERFAERILVPYSNIRHLDYRDGLSLYAAAETALPFTSRALTHHKGLWIKKKGRDLDGALKAYDQALRGTAGPQNTKVEQEEFIHTSRASALIEKMERGELSRDDGKQQALSALEKSRSTTFINAHAVHVYAKLVSKVAFGYSVDDEVDRFDLVNKALADVDRTLALIRSSRFRRTNAAESVEKLREIRDKIIMRCNFSAETAEDLWIRFGSQIGFALETRRLTNEAISSRNRGTEYKQAFDFWLTAQAKISAKGLELSPEFAEVGVQTYYSWQIHPRNHDRRRTPHDPVKWPLVADLSERVLASERYRGDPFYRYLYGLALAHKGDWRNAHIVFDENRRLNMPGDALHMPRCYFLHPEGVPWKLEGNVKHGASELFFNAIDLRQGFIANRGEHWPRGDALTHAYVVFSFAGPKATRSERACSDNL